MNLHSRIQNQENILRLVRLARAFEAKGILNGAKLLRAMAFSDETRLTELPDGQADADWVEAEMKALIREVSNNGEDVLVQKGLEHALDGYRENRTILREDAPPVFVCRFCGEIAFEQPPARCPSCGARELSFREFLPYYFLEPITSQQALDGLRSAAREIEGMVRGLNEEQMSWSPMSGEWGISNLLWHLLTAQQLLSGRVEKMLTEDNPSLASVAAWAVASDETSSGMEIFEEYLHMRQASIQRLEGLAPADWLRGGMHDEFGPVTVLSQAGYFARHDQLHLPQLEKLRDRVANLKES